MTIDELYKSGTIIFTGIVGSQAYGIATPTSDIDRKGVFIQDEDSILGFGYVEQVNDDKNDQTFYEIRRFLQLIQQNNPNLLELLNLPEDCIVYKDPIFDMILDHKDKFISVICKNSFGGYAVEQIKKARGLNKKIVNPMEMERRSVLDFCYVLDGTNQQTLNQYLKIEHPDLNQKDFGLVGLDHIKYTYAVHYSKDPEIVFRGIVTDEETSNDVCLSSVPKGWNPLFLLYFNKEGYSTYCRDYKAYWDWVDKRNDARYSDNALHGKGYDSKNLCHCFRLLQMAKEIGQGEGIIVRRPNRDELLKIKKGEMDYDFLIGEAETLIKELDLVYENSKLPESIDNEFVNSLLIEMRREFYKRI